jgi:hypothetical protein
MLLILLACTGAPANDAPKPDDTGDTGPDTAPDDTGAGPVVGSVADADAILYGASSDAVGNAVAFAGDDDGDGYDAVVVGAAFPGRTCLWRGPLAPGSHDFAALETCWAPEGARDYAGQAVDGGRDVTGDGVPDLLVGAIANGEVGPLAGKVYVIAGPYVGGSLADAELQLLGESDSDYAGTAVVLLGDIDGDGGGDLLVGAPSNDAGGSGAGRAYLVRGPMEPGTWSVGDAWATFTGEGPSALRHGAPAAGDGVGSVACAAGDMNGDGLADLVLGANGNELGGNDAGVAAIFFGPVGEGDHPLQDADQLWIGEVPLQFVGDAVAAAGDLDGDGLADVLVSGEMEGPGTVWVVSGPGLSGTNPIGAATMRFEGEAILNFAGAATAGAGDTDGDGWSDVLIGAYGRDRSAMDGEEEAGAAYLLRGPFAPGVFDLRDADQAWHGHAPGDEAGRAVAGGGDLDGDGRGDVVVAAPYSDSGGAFGGEVYAFFGP